MKWVKDLDRELGTDLHKTDKPDKPKVLREYSIQRETFSFGAKPASTNRRNPGALSGVRFTLNIFRSDLMKAIAKHLIDQKSKTIRIGKQKCIVSQVLYNDVDLIDLIADARALQQVRLSFKTPTAFKQMGTSRYCTTPVPEKIFGKLIKQGNRVNDDLHQCPEELYEWLASHVAVTRTHLYHKKWLMGKGSLRFHGFTGDVEMKVLVDHEPFQKWMHTLLCFGEMSNTGSGRTAGFGSYQVKAFDRNDKH